MTELDKPISDQEDDIIKKRRKIFSMVSIILFLLFSFAIFWFIGRKMIVFFSEPEKFRSWVDSQGSKSRLIFIGMVAFQIIIALIPGEPLEIGAGYAFGVIEGTLLCMAGILLGSIIVFLFSRYFGVKAVEAIYPREKLNKLNFLNNPKKLNTLTFILFLIPGTPKDIMTYFMGLTTMKLTTWIAISTIARIPSVITSTIGGNALGQREYIFAVIAFGITIVISILGILIHKKISKSHENAEEDT
ncbi:MAG: VTT domain-containing protein [Clostridiales bacterium]|nr:VTT domain-containing protein [Clostridiales bacterium]